MPWVYDGQSGSHHLIFVKKKHAHTHTLLQVGIISRQGWLYDKVDHNRCHIGDEDKEVKNVESPAQIRALVKDHPQSHHLIGRGNSAVFRLYLFKAIVVPNIVHEKQLWLLTL